MTDGGCYLEAPVGCEGIVKEVELKASNIHLVHLQWGFNFTYDIHVWIAQIHLRVSGHAKTNEPLVKLGGFCPGDIQGLVFEDVLLHPEFKS